ncbi:heavy metal translocatin [Multifurca ochricompacta]|uniref:Heavy metal translocatin n=1 Tax=Multifurca ochricompacta TaxID=376703 RepID=A0AAD4MCI3_9AGAM|nr:heavy metal translocatin [Multifurca ochricompacta]
MSVNTRDEVITTIFISNLHCGSCVHTIEEALQVLTPSSYSIHVSILSQCVIIRHPTSLLYFTMKEAIEDAGFEIADATGADHKQPSEPKDSSATSRKAKKHLEQCRVCQHEINSGLNSPEIPEVVAPSEHSLHLPVSLETTAYQSHAPSRLTLSVGGMTCPSCATAIFQALSGISGVHDVVVSLLGNSATVILDNKTIMGNVLETIKAIGYEADVVSLQPLDTGTIRFDMDGPFYLSLSVGGMTCVSCSSTITRILCELEGVTDVSVNLIGNSASLTVESKKLITEVQDVVQSAGYEVSVVNVEPVKVMPNDPRAQPGLRSIALRIEGMFCDHCPEKIAECLEKMDQIKCAEPPTLSDPILRLTYGPSPPTFTIRDIVSAIVLSSSPPFRVTVQKTPSLEDRARSVQAREKRSLLYRLGFSIIVAVPTFIIGVVFMSFTPTKNRTRQFLMEPMWIGNASRVQWSLFFLATPIMFYSAGKFHRRSVKEVYALWRRGSRTPIWNRFLRFGSMNLLISSGVSVAYFSSIVLLALAASSSASPDGHGDTSTYFDSVVFLTMLLLVGRYIEAYSKSRTGDAITSLAKLKPAEALVVGLADEKAPFVSFHREDEDIEKGNKDVETQVHISKPSSRVQKVPVDLLETGDVVRVTNGSTPPIDGVVVDGHSSFDESLVTGESKPIKKNPGDHVFLGSVNIGQAIDVRIDVGEGKTMLDHIINVVRDSQTKRAPIERFADLLTGYFVPVVTLLALITWTTWLSLGLGNALPRSYLDKDVGGWPLWSLEFAIAVFVVACPCGIGLAAPTALLVGSGVAAKFGILVRGGGEAFQEAAQLDTIVFDKTGTLTMGGRPTVTDCEDLCASGPWKRETVLRLAAEMEASSSHPLAMAIRSYCEGNHAAFYPATSVEERPGRGLKATFKGIGCVAIIGNEAWMAENGAEVHTEFASRLESWKSEGKSVVLLAIRQDDTVEASPESSPFRVLVFFAIADSLRPDAKAVVTHLQSQKLSVWMISGDNSTTAKAVAKQAGIPESNVIAGVLPHEKAEKVRWLQENAPKKQRSKLKRLFGRKPNNRCVVAMVGDGINDAPALAASDVAIAIGSGSDVALSSASFILISSNLGSILTLVDLSSTVYRRVKLNFLWALVYNMAALPVAAGVLYPIRNIRLSPVFASLAMAFSVSVVCSSLMLKLYKPPRQKQINC